MLTRKIKLTVNSIVLIGAASAFGVSAADEGIIIGIDAGQADAHKFCHNISNCDHADTSIRGDVGYQFSKNRGAEYQLYTDISRVDGAKDDVQGLYAGGVFRF